MVRLRLPTTPARANVRALGVWSEITDRRVKTGEPSNINTSSKFSIDLLVATEYFT